MGLADRLVNDRPDFKPRFRQIVDSLSPADRDALIAAAKDPAWSNAALGAALRKEGIIVGKEALKNWRADVTGR